MSSAVLTLDAVNAHAAKARPASPVSVARTPRRRSWLAELIIAPFQDVDDRVQIRR